MSHPNTAIVVLSHNSIEITKKFLELLFKRTKNFYLIMIDNGSTDSTVDYLESKSYTNENNLSMMLIYNQQNLGVIGGRNQGYAFYQTLESVPDYLCFLDNDQFVREGWLEQHHEFMQNGKYDVIGADAWLMNHLYKPVHNCKNVGEPFSYVGCGGMMIKKPVLDKIELFDEQFNPAFFEDPDFCYDNKTYIMTKNGLVLFSEVSMNDEILTRKDDNTLEYNKPVRVIKKYESKLLHFSSQQIDICCTPEQYLLVGYKRKSYKNVDKGCFIPPNFIQAKEIVKKLYPNQCRYYIEKCGGFWKGNDDTLINIKDFTFKFIDFSVFMGWYLSEGSVITNQIKRKNKRSNEIRISKIKNLNKRNEIKKAIENLGFMPNEQKDGYYFSNKEFCDYLQQFGKSDTKFIPNEIKNGSVSIIKAFLDAYIKGDGSIKNNGFSLCTSSKKMKEDLIEVIIKIGRSFVVYHKEKHLASFPNNKEFHCNETWKIKSYDKSFAYLPVPKEIEYNDFVYDVTVSNHRIFIVRNNKGCWSSNCFRARQNGFSIGWNVTAKIDHLPHQTLGKCKDRMNYFKQSYGRFVKKWQDVTMNPIRQNPNI